MLSNTFGKFKHLLSNTGFIVNILTEKLGGIAAAELGLTHSSKTNGLLYCVGTEHDRIQKMCSGFLIYQGHHMPKQLSSIDHLLLPTCSFVEKNSTYLNFEGTLRHSKTAVTPFRKLMTDVEVFRLLNKVMETVIPTRYSMLNDFSKIHTLLQGHSLTYNSIFFKHIDDFTSSFIRQSGVLLNSSETLHLSNELLPLTKIKYNNSILNRKIDNYYSSDATSRLSKTMSLCAQKLTHSHFS